MHVVYECASTCGVRKYVIHNFVYVRVVASILHQEVSCIYMAIYIYMHIYIFIFMYIYMYIFIYI